MLIESAIGYPSQHCMLGNPLLHCPARTHHIRPTVIGTLCHEIHKTVIFQAYTDMSDSQGLPDVCQCFGNRHFVHKMSRTYRQPLLMNRTLIIVGLEIDKVEGFTIRGYKGTEAERYANANGFKFVELSGKTVQGDADGDGVIDSRDRVCLTRHLAKWAGYEDIDEKAADVNADGKVDTKDRIILARHIAKWKGYESLPYKG